MDNYFCFTTTLNNYGNLDVTYEKFDDIYSALIYGYKKSFTKCKYNVPNYNQFFPGYQCKSLVGQSIIIYHEKIRKAKFIQRKFRKHLERRNNSAKIIQDQFRESIANPSYEMCKRRLLREYYECNSLLN